MNLSKGSKIVPKNDLQMHNSQSDFQKLMDICNSYGLSQQETNQLIEQFRKGALFSPHKSIDDSLNESYGDLTFSHRQEEQEYSFKNRKEEIQIKTFQKYKAKQSQIKIEQEHQKSSVLSVVKQQKPMHYQNLQRLLMDKFSIQKTLVNNLQQENQSLKRSLHEKSNQINNLISMKHQDSNIIKGLKDIISHLTMTVKEKDLSFKEVNDKYTNLMESKLKEMSARVYTEFNEPENPLKEYTNLTSSFTRTNSTNKFKNTTTMLGESRDNHEGTRAVNKTMAESREQQLKLNSNKADGLYNQVKKNRTNNRVDVKKYKEMIQNLRNNY